MKTTKSAQLFYRLGEPPRRPEDWQSIGDVIDHRVIVCVRTVEPGPWGDVETAHVYLESDTSRIELKQRYVYHSPSGMEWGYGGSGPADLALNILALVVPAKEAVRMHQEFKFEHIATLARDEGRITLASVRRWIAAWYRRDVSE